MKVDAGACNLAAPFGAPVAIPAVNTGYSEDLMWLTPDLLNAFVDATRPDSGSYDLYTTTRSAVDASFGPLVPLPGPINTNAPERTPVASADGLTLYYAQQATKFQIFVATRASTSVPFGAGQLAAPPLDNTTSDDAVSWLSADALTILIQSSRGDGTTSHIYVATRASTSVAFGAPTMAGMPNSTSAEYGGVMTADQLTMYFQSSRPGGLGSYDIWKATRSTINDGFGAAVDVSELSTPLTDGTSWVSPDGCSIYIQQSQADAGATYDVFFAQKPAL